MLKIKDNFDLKELEKFDFKSDVYNLWYEYHSKENSKDSIIVNIENRELGFYQNYNGKSYDVLFDLIKSDLVEKVEE